MAPHVKSICNIMAVFSKNIFFPAQKPVGSYRIFMEGTRKYRCGVFWG
ncbi:hypothetical protein HMPREF1147_0376 [Selenomonas sp. FOBRC9]|nr:hypothetical protein HMPREF1147_0376 [Selenomonas sp. FOBRC9]